MITALSSGFQRHSDHQGFAQFVTRSDFDPPAAYALYQRSAKIEWSSSCLSVCWFRYTFADGQVHRLSAAEITLLKPTGSGELAPPLVLAVPVVSRAIEESDWNVIANFVAYLGMPSRSYGATPSVPLASPGVVFDLLDVD